MAQFLPRADASETREPHFDSIHFKTLKVAFVSWAVQYKDDTTIDKNLTLPWLLWPKTNTQATTTSVTALSIKKQYTAIGPSISHGTVSKEYAALIMLSSRSKKVNNFDIWNHSKMLKKKIIKVSIFAFAKSKNLDTNNIEI